MAQQQNQPRKTYENRSRLGLASPAIRPGMKGRVLLAGPSGAGKTYTALLIAMSLREHVDTASVLMIDTEKDSGKTYADEFVLDDGSPAYMHLPWAAPYDAADLEMTLNDASGKYDVVIIDSHSHFWTGQGGVLDVAGGRYTGWAEARPMHANMIQAILSCDAHVILCARMKQDHVQELSATGKWEVRKVGMKIKQDEELEYEVNVALEVDMTHTLHVSKSRTRAVPVGSEFLPGQAEKFAGTYRDWLAGGEPAASKEQIDNLIAVLNRIEDPPTRQQAKRDFVDHFGQPHLLLESRLSEAQEWVADRLIGGTETADRAPDEVPPETTEDLEDQKPQAEPDLSGQPENAGAKELPQKAPVPTTDVELPPCDTDPSEAFKALEGLPPSTEWVALLGDDDVIVELVAFQLEPKKTKTARERQLINAYEARVLHSECGKLATGPRRKAEPFCECPI